MRPNSRVASAKLSPIVEGNVAALGTLLLVMTLLLASNTAAADQLVVRLQSFSADAAGPQTALPAGLPSPMSFPLATSSQGAVTISLRQEDLDGSVPKGEGASPIRLRLLSSAVGSVTDGARGEVAVGMDTALAVENLATGTSRVFDIKIRGSAESSAAYGDALPIYIEAWRRSDDGKPIENPTKENRSFWGTLSGRFEP